MTLHPDQVILGAVQEGTCADVNDANPYEPEDKKRFLGWEQGHKRAIEEYEQQQKHDSLSLSRTIKCKLGFHNYILKKIPGRPHIDPKGTITRRDPIIKKYTCVYCDNVYFLGLGN